MKYYIISLVIFFTILYLWTANRTEKFRKQIKTGMKASYYSGNSKIKGKITEIFRDKSGNPTFVEVDGIKKHVDNIYR